MKNMISCQAGLLALVLFGIAPVFAGSCDLSSVTLINQTQLPLTWSTGIDVGTVGVITSAQKTTQPIRPGQQIHIVLHDDKSGVRGYFNIYDNTDSLVAILNINYKSDKKACKLSKSYKNVKSGYKIAYPSKDSKSDHDSEVLAANNTTFYIKQS